MGRSEVDASHRAGRSEPPNRQDIYSLISGMHAVIDAERMHEDSGVAIAQFADGFGIVAQQHVDAIGGIGHALLILGREPNLGQSLLRRRLPMHGVLHARPSDFQTSVSGRPGSRSKASSSAAE